jgi:acetyl esterase/lipase
VRSLGALGIALLMVGMAMWTVVPAPVIPILLMTIGVTEFALPLFIAFAAIGLGLFFWARGVARVCAVALSALALAALAVPLMSAWTTWPQVDAVLRAGGIAPLRSRALATVDVRRDLPVALRDGSAAALDLYRPATSGRLPLIVTIYGGAWMFGSRADEEPLARWYAARGYAVAVIDYRHAPAYRFPTQSDDVDDALAAIARDAAAWRVDRERVALFGRSAGAQLALLAGERAQPLRVRAIVAYYAPTDLVRGWQDPPRPDPADVRGILNAYLGGPPDATHIASYRAASPLENARAGMPPVIAIIGDRDELVRPEFQRSFAARLDALHVRNLALELPWAGHAFDAVNGLGGAVAHHATLRFLDALL